MSEPIPSPTFEITTVSDDTIVVHRRGPEPAAVRTVGLPADTDHNLDPVTGQAIPAIAGAPTQALSVRTLRRPAGALLARVATVNDVHFGEVEAGRIDDHEIGPIRRAAPDAPPYPEVMNGAAADEIAAVDPAAVIVKGDLTLDGTPDEFAAFEACYRLRFGDALHVVRGNHDAYRHQADYAGDHRVDVEGLTLALLDTVIPGATTGTLHADQFEWLDTLAGSTDHPVLVMGHHQQWIGSPGGNRSDDYFGLHPDASDRLDEVVAGHDHVLGYAAGHTHRHRVRRMNRSGALSIEVGCTKDFPGTWAEYKVYEGGITQVVHRMSSPAALAWSESCRNLYGDFGVDYETYALGTLDERCFVF